MTTLLAVRPIATSIRFRTQASRQGAECLLVVLAMTLPSCAQKIKPPIANAGSDQTVNVGATVQLDGTQSFDPAGRPTAFNWSFIKRPMGSAAVLSDTQSPSPTLVADEPGEYGLALVVSNALLASQPAFVGITATAGNRAPVASVVAPQHATVGALVTLDGSGSSDPDGDSIAYAWQLVVPQGGTAFLSSPTAVMPTFVPDVAGSYAAQLTVTDSRGARSAPTTTVVAVPIS